MTEKNNIFGDNAGRDINKNNYFHYVPIHENLTVFLNDISTKVNDNLPNGVYNYNLKKSVPFSGDELFESLMQIAIPSKVVFDVIIKIPDKIKTIENLDNFSTRNLRSIIYKLLQSLDYTKYGEKVDIWGENYIRKYGNPDVEISVILDDENRIEVLNYEFLYEKLIPDIYYKCYHRNIDDDLKVIYSKFLKQEIASEILEKVRILNLYLIRYSTLKKLAYDMAIQPPHPWFTNKLNTDKHLEYHCTRYKNHYKNYLNQIETERAAQEFVEHSCAAILSQYNLFIGLGKYRPLITLMNYLKLNNENNGNQLYWQSLDISNISGDIYSSYYSFGKFAATLDNILVLIKSQDHYEELKQAFKELKDLTDLIISSQKYLKTLGNPNSLYELKEFSLNIFRLYDRMKVYDHCIKIPLTEIPAGRIKPYISLCFIFENDLLKTDNFIFNELGSNSNSVLVITDVDIPDFRINEKIREKELNVESIFSITFRDLYINTISPNRRIELEHLLMDNQI